MKVIGISGSPMKGGNTDTAVEAVLAGARAQGAQTEMVRLYELDVAPCDGCDACMEGRGCVIDDDASALIGRMERADVVVFGTPVYWYHVSGVMKNFVDRTYSSFHHKTLAGKRVVAILVEHSSGADEAVSLFRHWCEDEDCVLVDAVTIDTGSKPGVVAGDEDLLCRLSKLGGSLAG